MKCNTGKILTLSAKITSNTSSSSEPIGLLRTLSCAIVVKSTLKKTKVIIHDRFFEAPILWEEVDIPHIHMAIGTCIVINGPPIVNRMSTSIPSQHNPTFYLSNNLNKSTNCVQYVVEEKLQWQI